MRSVFFAPFAVFFERQFPFHFADVFMRPVIVPFAYGALKPNEIWLRHVFWLRSISEAGGFDFAPREIPGFSGHLR